ncbi:amidohydrolase [Falsarthrobacter nasiphocae]|uniref:Hippurate hydrolase n=1 Tax=Falsarthrobacter nasiphocae TaxID=189863 RepID=A0AAE4C769_9MICC|nr:amidohydrolase [Falsarthrobacter nasiphocae]MDR6892239.1 hippurate hydrolase [Falsarthrobacter nasiphocae]
MSLPESIAADLDATMEWLEPLYKDLHAHPELSMQEERTAALVAERLEGFGYAVTRLGGGVVGVLENGEGPAVLFRADMDGLPVREETGADYASTATAQRDGVEVPVMHACGHDVHTACALGAASLLAAHRKEWSGTAIMLFQPGEEVARGARSMVDAGLAKRIPAPVVALGQHVMAGPPAGEVAISAGPVFSTAVSLRVRLFGKGGHGSMPHLAIDSVVLAAAVVTRLQSLVARELSPDEFGVVTVGSMRAGDTANIIPDSAELLLNLRAYSEETLAALEEGVERIVRAECQAGRCPREPEIQRYDPFPLTVNDERAVETLRSAFSGAFGADGVHAMERVTASEDFSIIPDALGVPYAYWALGGFTPDQDPVGNHNPHFLPALQPTLTGGVVASAAAMLAFLGRS